MPLFLQGIYLQITATLTKNLLFYRLQRNIQAQQKLYSSLCLSQMIHNPYPLKTSLLLLKSPPLISHPQLLWLKMSLTLQYKPCLTESKNNLKNFLQGCVDDLKNNLKNWIISNQSHSAYQRIPRTPKKKITFFHQNQLNRGIISLHLPHPLNNDLRICVSEIELAEILELKKWNLKQQFKWNLMRSNPTTWKPSTTSTWKYKLSHQKNILHPMNNHLLISPNGHSSNHLENIHMHNNQPNIFPTLNLEVILSFNFKNGGVPLVTPSINTYQQTRSGRHKNISKHQIMIYLYFPSHQTLIQIHHIKRIPPIILKITSSSPY